MNQSPNAIYVGDDVTFKGGELHGVAAKIIQVPYGSRKFWVLERDFGLTDAKLRDEFVWPIRLVD